MVETRDRLVFAPGEPAFIRRLPNGVEYTHIKMIFQDLPSSLTTLLWRDESAGDTLLTAFKGRTARAIQRALRRAEAIGHDRERVDLIRHELVQLCLAALNSRANPHPDRAMTVEHVFPHLFAPEHRPDISVPHVRITVRRRGANGRALETQTIVSEPAAWDASIPWIDPAHVDRTILELLNRHFPRLMGVRVGPPWRSSYAPEGWRLVTQHAVPALYEYLRPFYRVRPHRRIGRKDGPGLYPARLREDITDIVRFELGLLAKDLTVPRVTAAIQRHIARKHSNRKPTTRKRPKQ
jgi:hypothetical protein